MTSKKDPFLRLLTRRRPAMVEMLRQFVECESPSPDKAAVDRFGGMVAAALRQSGAEVRAIPSRRTGDHLRAEFRLAEKRSARQILLLGHLDTVWPLGTLAQMPFRIKNGRACGPGVFDMKAGLVLVIFALQALRELEVPMQRNVALLLNADEEIGSPASRATTEREARRSDCVLVLEPSLGPQGALKTARKGVGEFLLRVEGRAAHTGLDPEKGASAVLELSKQIVRLQSLADSNSGITINAGVIRGGTRTNVIPSEAEAQIDVRMSRAADQRNIEKLFRGLKPFDRRTRLIVSGGINRPPMERTSRIAMLFNRARRLAGPLGINLKEAAVGGGSDGNFTAALGVPTLDGLGAVGDGAHALNEHVAIAELPRRAALLAHLIASLASE